MVADAVRALALPELSRHAEEQPNTALLSLESGVPAPRPHPSAVAAAVQSRGRALTLSLLETSHKLSSLLALGVQSREVFAMIVDQIMNPLPEMLTGLIMGIMAKPLMLLLGKLLACILPPILLPNDANMPCLVPGDDGFPMPAAAPPPAKPCVCPAKFHQPGEATPASLLERGGAQRGGAPGLSGGGKAQLSALLRARGAAETMEIAIAHNVSLQARSADGSCPCTEVEHKAKYSSLVQVHARVHAEEQGTLYAAGIGKQDDPLTVITKELKKGAAGTALEVRARGGGCGERGWLTWECAAQLSGPTVVAQASTTLLKTLAERVNYQALRGVTRGVLQAGTSACTAALRAALAAAGL